MNEHKGHANSKKQLRALDASNESLGGVAAGLQALFDGEFEKTCTPAIAAEYSRKMRESLAQIHASLAIIDKHANLDPISQGKVIGTDGKLHPYRSGVNVEQVEQIRSLRESGLSMRVIASTVGCSVGTVHNALKD